MPRRAQGAKGTVTCSAGELVKETAEEGLGAGLCFISNNVGLLPQVFPMNSIQHTRGRKDRIVLFGDENGIARNPRADKIRMKSQGNEKQKCRNTVSQVKAGKEMGGGGSVASWRCCLVTM